MSDTIELGSEVTDKITGFSGIAIARYEWLTGCVRWEVQPVRLGIDLKVVASESFDASRLKVVKKPTKQMLGIKTLGGPMPAPKRPTGPR